MQFTLAAVFTSQDAALDATKALLAAGFNCTDVNVSSADAAGQTSSVTDASTGTDEAHEASAGVSIKQFFTGLSSGDNDEHASRYSDAVSLGHHVLTLVTGSEYEVQPRQGNHGALRSHRHRSPKRSINK